MVHHHFQKYSQVSSFITETEYDTQTLPLEIFLEKISFGLRIPIIFIGVKVIFDHIESSIFSLKLLLRFSCSLVFDAIA